MLADKKRNLATSCTVLLGAWGLAEGNRAFCLEEREDTHHIATQQSVSSTEKSSGLDPGAIRIAASNTIRRRNGKREWQTLIQKATAFEMPY
jgi:hypothetical protein